MKFGQDMLFFFPQLAGAYTQRYARVDRVLASVVRRLQSPAKNKTSRVQSQRQKLSNTPPFLPQH